MSVGNFLGICKNLYFSSRNFVYVWFLLEWSYKFSGKNYFKYCINYSYLDIFHSKLWDNISLLKDIYLNFRICCILNKFVSFDDLFFFWYWGLFDPVGNFSKSYEENKMFYQNKCSEDFEWIMFNHLLLKMSVILREKRKSSYFVA